MLEFLDKLGQERPVFLPGTTPMLSYSAFQVLAAAIEAQQHSSFAQVAKSRIFDPLNMRDTTFLTGCQDTGVNKSQPNEPA